MNFSFYTSYYYLFDLDTFIIKIIKSNNSLTIKKDKENTFFLQRLNLLLD
jgi:hypothetical protein